MIAEGLDTGLALIFLLQLPPLVACIPVATGWLQIKFAKWNGDGQNAFPVALSTLTLSACINPIAYLFLKIV